MVSVKIFPEMVRFKRVNDEITETSKALKNNIYILQSPLLVLFFSQFQELFYLSVHITISS